MTELERILKNTLTAMERELTASREAQEKTLAAHDQAIQDLQTQVTRLQTEQQESARHLQRLSAIHANLEPLLSRLNDILSAR